MLASDTQTWIDIVKQGGPLAALLGIILYGGFKSNPWWVFGWVFRDLECRLKETKAESDDWRDIALAGTHIANTLAKREKEKS